MSSSNQSVVLLSKVLPQVQEAVRGPDPDATELEVTRFLKPLERDGTLDPIVSLEGDLLGWKLKRPLPATALEALRQLAALVNKPYDHPNHPDDPDVVEMHAARCLASTRTYAHESSSGDRRLRLGGFRQQLAGFPEDVIAGGFYKWERINEERPTPADIVEFCHRLMRWRRSLLELVNIEPPPPPPPLPAESSPRPAPAEIESVRAMLDRAFGRRPAQTTPEVQHSDPAAQARHRFEATIQNYAIAHFAQPERGEVLEVLWGLRGEKAKTAMLKKLNKQMRAERWEDPTAEPAGLQQIKAPSPHHP
jgi:hypothetical protein